MNQGLVLASNNAGKLREFAELLKPFAIDVVAQGQLNIPAAEEPFETFVDNALAKARHASLLSALPALADDSGICVDACQTLLCRHRMPRAKWVHLNHSVH
jgi:XTP/dITP diphosphohydrolase